MEVYMDHAHKPQELEMGGAGLPARRRSPLWSWTQEISRRLAEGYSYAQIARALSRAGHPVSPRWLRRWCRAHLGRVYNATASARQPSGPPRGTDLPAAGTSDSVTPSLADAYGPEPTDILSDLRLTKRKST
jgi:hypothetical protein